MKDTVRKKILLFSLIVSMVFSAITVHADSFTETTADHAEDTEYSLLRGAYLASGTIGITKKSSTRVGVSGTTLCLRDCEDVYLYLYLERKTDGVYNTYKTWRYHITDDSILSRETLVTVPSGYYYRLRGYHAAQVGNRKESVTTLTDSIWVG